MPLIGLPSASPKRLSPNCPIKPSTLPFKDMSVGLAANSRFGTCPLSAWFVQSQDLRNRVDDGIVTLLLRLGTDKGLSSGGWAGSQIPAISSTSSQSMQGLPLYASPAPHSHEQKCYSYGTGVQMYIIQDQALCMLHVTGYWQAWRRCMLHLRVCQRSREGGPACRQQLGRSKAGYRQSASAYLDLT